MSRLRLRISHLEPPAEGGWLVLSVGETQAVAITVNVVGCSSCSVELLVDREHFELIGGEPRAEPGVGTFKRTLRWTLRAMAPGDSLSIDVRATADEKYQTTMVPVKIHPLPRIED